MARTRKRRTGWGTGFTNTPNVDGTFIPLEDFHDDAGEIGLVRISWEAWGETVANMITRPGYQVADVENNILGTNTLGTDTKTGAGVLYGTDFFDISGNTKARVKIRFGIWVKNPAGNSNLNCVRVRAWIEIQDC
jgi:hypothetical protein